MTDPVQDLTGEFREFAGEVKGHVREHATWIAEAAPLVEDHTATLSGHVARLAEDAAALVTLREEVDELLAEMPRQPRHPPICWVRLTADQAREVWTQLGGWVSEILVDRYSVSRGELPDCWALHPGAVEAITWLRTSWLHAWVANAGANPAAEWHTRWRQAALDDVQRAVVREATTRRKEKCVPGVHLGEPLPGTQPVTRTDPAGFGPDPARAGVWTSGPRPLGEDLGVDPSEDLAEPGFWWPHLAVQAAEDVERRREAERQAAEAEAAAAATPAS